MMDVSTYHIDQERNEGNGFVRLSPIINLKWREICY